MALQRVRPRNAAIPVLIGRRVEELLVRNDHCVVRRGRELPDLFVQPLQHVAFGFDLEQDQSVAEHRTDIGPASADDKLVHHASAWSVTVQKPDQGVSDLVLGR
ncbi:hypothetical protein C3941_25350 [Kaistia algarum]|nr:hypothetical protein C3941_25350 [Kaistia algarum]